jgi:DNA-binding CsgD family transcriptional regulator
MTANRVKLSEIDRDHLVHAVESATRVKHQADFRTWICSDFYSLLPHDGMVCVEIDEQGGIDLVECLRYNTTSAGVTAFDCDRFYDLSLRLLRSLPRNPPISHLLDASAIGVLMESDGDAPGEMTRDVRNAVIHRIEFLSGAKYHLVLFNLPQDKAPRSPHLFKLLSSHVKMALSWRVTHREATKQVSLTPREREILERMRAGDSNREISALLGINPITLKTHVAKIYRKLDVQTRAEAIMHGLNTAGLTEPATN